MLDAMVVAEEFFVWDFSLIYGRDTAVKGLEWQVDKQRKLNNILADTRKTTDALLLINYTFSGCEQEVVCTVYYQ